MIKIWKLSEIGLQGPLKIVFLHIIQISCTVKPVFKGHYDERTGQPVIRGHFLRTVSSLPHVKEPVMKGHLSCRDTFLSDIEVSLEDRFYCNWKYK